MRRQTNPESVNTTTSLFPTVLKNSLLKAKPRRLATRKPLQKEWILCRILPAKVIPTVMLAICILKELSSYIKSIWETITISLLSVLTNLLVCLVLLASMRTNSAKTRTRRKKKLQIGLLKNVSCSMLLTLPTPKKSKSTMSATICSENFLKLASVVKMMTKTLIPLQNSKAAKLCEFSSRKRSLVQVVITKQFQSTLNLVKKIMKMQKLKKPLVWTSC